MNAHGIRDYLGLQEFPPNLAVWIVTNSPPAFGSRRAKRRPDGRIRLPSRSTALLPKIFRRLVAGGEPSTRVPQAIACNV